MEYIGEKHHCAWTEEGSDVAIYCPCKNILQMSKNIVLQSA